jgi:hypothetical protein
MLVYCAADLLWATKIKAAADAMGIPARPVRSVEMLEDRLKDSDIKGLIVDLDSPDVANLLIRRLRGPDADQGQASIPILAFGPHVATDLFEAAKREGADIVLPRGAFDRRLHDILAQLHSGLLVRPK